MVEKLKKKII